MQEVTALGRSAGGAILIEITPEERQPTREHKRKGRHQSIKLKFAPFCHLLIHGVSLIKEWIKDEGLAIPKDTTVYTQLREIKTEDLKGNPEEVFYAINGLRYVIGGFETSLSSPTIRRPVPTEVPPGAWT